MKVIICGFISGMVSSLGCGGGAVLVFLLTFFLGVEQHLAQGANLIFFIPTAITAIFMNIKNKNIILKKVWIIIVAGMIGAIIGAKISTVLDVKLLKKYFGFFLLLIAVMEIYNFKKLYIRRENTDNNKK